MGSITRSYWGGRYGPRSKSAICQIKFAKSLWSGIDPVCSLEFCVPLALVRVDSAPQHIFTHRSTEGMRLHTVPFSLEAGRRPARSHFGFDDFTEGFWGPDVHGWLNLSKDG
jgi:hypothetical protein